METAWDTMKGNMDEDVFHEIEEWVITTEEEVNNALRESEEFLEVRETGISLEHKPPGST